MNIVKKAEPSFKQFFNLVFNLGAPCPNRDNLSERQGQFNDQLAAHRIKECNNSDDKDNPKKNCKFPDKIGSENGTIFEVMLCDECGGNGTFVVLLILSGQIYRSDLKGSKTGFLNFLI